MSFEIDPSRVRGVWADGVGEGREQLAGSQGDRDTARGQSLEDLAGPMGAAADVLDGVTATALAVVDELGEAMLACLATYEATDGASASSFPALTMPGQVP
ncbi:hypothetical protein JQN72_03685 [Phycicoccus sp. CSK15P-2]|uniref:hypothetical protein n=1 Tax=Phycicoccus sp. CSK15P-2 TaxID=2807627 RepID=UPI00195229EB|nr:hypothetical protein [Phycicoccus sp. CSK15P-2]MBM6403342.1 hypothetical protein [Phycicoccus sp. CSK15P-2]